MKHMTIRENEKGFTLVELAIVMIIIGLLMGGVIKGQELINNARVAAVVTEMKAFDVALSTFRDTYNGFPGDLRTPQTRVRNCAALPCSDPGDGNGRIGDANNGTAGELFVTAVITDENFVAWIQMENAGVIAAVDGSSDVEYGAGLPVSSFDAGGYTIAYHRGGDLFSGVDASSGHWLQLSAGDATNAPVAADAATAGFIAASLAARVDRKMDNGIPNTGAVREVADDGNIVADTSCQVAGVAATDPDVYDEAANTRSCALLISLSN